MKLFGKDAVLTPLAKAIMEEDLEILKQEFPNGNKINECIHMTEYIDEPPIILALIENKTAVVDWLISMNADLNIKDKPAIVAAASNCSSDIITMLINNGADVNVIDRVGKTAVNAALYSSNFDALKTLVSSGYNIKGDGTVLRQAVANQQHEAIDILLNYGIDVNFCVPDMVYPYNSTPVTVAAEKNDFETVKKLVEHGADITTKDDYGSRPYSAAAENKNIEMMEYLKRLEPEEWHNEEQKLMALKSYKLPIGLIELLRSSNRKIEINDNDYIAYLEFHSLINSKEVKWNKHKFLDLVSDADQYGAEGFLVWYPKKKCLAFADYEHDKFTELCKWKDFVKNPSQCINKIFE